MIIPVKTAVLRSWSELQALVDRVYEEMDCLIRTTHAMIFDLGDRLLTVLENNQGCLVLAYSDGLAFCAIKPIGLKNV